MVGGPDPDVGSLPVQLCPWFHLIVGNNNMYPSSQNLTGKIILSNRLG